MAKLIGATDAFIRRPFFYLGLLQGLAGGALAVVIVWIALGLLNRGGPRARRELTARPSSCPISRPAMTLAVIALAGLLGWLGAHLSVSRHLREMD